MTSSRGTSQPRIEPVSPALQMDVFTAETLGKLRLLNYFLPEY